MKSYFDSSFITNPFNNYIRWFITKIYYQTQYWGKHLRIGYGALIKNSTFGRYNWLDSHSLTLNCDIGNYTYIGSYSVILNSKIGKYCSIAPNVKISPGNHPTSGFISTHPSTYSNPNFHSKRYVNENKFVCDEKVEIGNDVWIGANAVVKGGVKIADGAVIAANAVVIKDVGPYEIVGGVPAKFIKKRFKNEEIEVLKVIKWWDKDEEWMKNNISKFWSVNEFVNMYNETK